MSYGIGSIRARAREIAAVTTDERTGLMLLALAAGASYGWIGRKFDLSRERVRQIMEKAAKRSGVDMPPYGSMDEEDWKRAKRMWGKVEKWPQYIRKGTRR